jgi:hypothetical protein
VRPDGFETEVVLTGRNNLGEWNLLWYSKVGRLNPLPRLPAAGSRECSTRKFNGVRSGGVEGVSPAIAIVW